MKRPRPKPRRHRERAETNEEIMHWSKDRFGYVRLRLQFQTRSPDLEGRPRYAGLKGKSITVAVRSPGMALQLIEHIEKSIERFVPAQATEEIKGSSASPIFTMESAHYAKASPPTQFPN